MEYDDRDTVPTLVKWMQRRLLELSLVSESRCVTSTLDQEVRAVVENCLVSEESHSRRAEASWLINDTSCRMGGGLSKLLSNDAPLGPALLGTSIESAWTSGSQNGCSLRFQWVLFSEEGTHAYEDMHDTNMGSVT